MGDQIAVDERRRHGRVTTTGPVLLTPTQKLDRPLLAVLNNANRVGAGFHAKQLLTVNEPVTVSMVFLDHAGQEQQETLAGTVAWMRPWEHGYLIGVVWDHIVNRDDHGWLYAYLDETLHDRGPSSPSRSSVPTGDLGLLPTPEITLPTVRSVW